MASLDGERLHERFGLDRLLLAVTCRAWLVRCLAEVGAFAEGRAICQEAVRMAEAVEHPLSQIVAYDGAGILYLRQGDLQQAIAVLEDSLELRQARGMTWGITPYPGFPGDASALVCAYALSGRLPEALQQLEQITSKAKGGEGWSAFVVEVCWLTGSPNVALMLTRSAARGLPHVQGTEPRTLGLTPPRRDLQVPRSSSNPGRLERSTARPSSWPRQLRMRPLLAHCHFGLGELLAG